MKLFLLFLAAVPLLWGCSEPTEPNDSDDFTNAELYAEMEAVSAGTGEVTVIARLSTGGTAMRLTGGDRFLTSVGPLKATSSGGIFEQTASYAQSVRKMEERSHVTWNLLFVTTADAPEYFAPMPSPGKEGTLYVTLQRDKYTSIADTPVPLPEPFEITAPLHGEVADPTVPVPLSWQPSGLPYSMELEMAAACEDGTGVGAARLIDGDPGSVELNLVDELFASQPPAVPCTIGLALSRVLYGAVSPGFGAGGLVRGVQRRTVTLRTL